MAASGIISRAVSSITADCLSFQQTTLLLMKFCPVQSIYLLLSTVLSFKVSI